MKRRKKIRWEYNGDGLFAKERIKGFWKRYWRKWRSRISNVDAKNKSVAPGVGVSEETDTV